MNVASHHKSGTTRLRVHAAHEYIRKFRQRHFIAMELASVTAGQLTKIMNKASKVECALNGRNTKIDVKLKSNGVRSSTGSTTND